MNLQHVTLMPDAFEAGTLYVSLEYGTAIHLCACGCGARVVTPLDGHHGWTFTEASGRATLRPSIGNYQIPCKSHYWITDGEVRWA